MKALLRAGECEPNTALNIATFFKDIRHWAKNLRNGPQISGRAIQCHQWWMSLSTLMPGPAPNPLMYSNAKSLPISDRIPWENTFFKWWGVSNGRGLVREVCYYQETDVFPNSLAGWGQELAGAGPPYITFQALSPATYQQPGPGQGPGLPPGVSIKK